MKPTTFSPTAEEMRDEPRRRCLSVRTRDRDDGDRRFGSRRIKHVDDRRTDVPRLTFSRMRVHADSRAGVHLDDHAAILAEWHGDVRREHVDARDVEPDDSSRHLARCDVVGCISSVRSIDVPPVDRFAVGAARRTRPSPGIVSIVRSLTRRDGRSVPSSHRKLCQHSSCGRRLGADPDSPISMSCANACACRRRSHAQARVPRQRRLFRSRRARDDRDPRANCSTTMRLPILADDLSHAARSCVVVVDSSGDSATVTRVERLEDDGKADLIARSRARPATVRRHRLSEPAVRCSRARAWCRPCPARSRRRSR